MGAWSPDHGEQVNTPAGRRPLQPEVARPLVAIVDNETDLLTMAETYLRRDGFRVVTAGDARTAAAVLRRRPVDLLVLDLMLPDGNRLDLLRGVRAGRHLSVIILTGPSSEHERVMGLKLGADDYVVKPFSLPELAARIRAVLRRTYPTPADLRRRLAAAGGTVPQITTVRGSGYRLDP